MTTLVIFVEEMSAKVMLENFLPKILPEDTQLFIIPFEGKSDLEKRLPLKLRAWELPDCAFVVIRDQDSEDCKTVKQRIVKICKESGKPDVLVRIACHELESWYLGNLDAVEKGLKIAGITKYQNKARFRDPDLIVNPSDEIKKITHGKYQKVSGSRVIGQFLDPTKSKSNSFIAFSNGILHITKCGK